MKCIELNRNDPRVQPFIHNYKGRRTVKIIESTAHHVSDYWDGGSRDYTSYSTMHGRPLSQQQVKFQKQTEGNPFNQNVGTVTIEPGIVVVVNAIFQGKDMGFRIYVHPQDYTLFEKSVSNT